MDSIFHPHMRKWISPPVQLESAVNEVKKLVRKKKEELIVIDPTPTSQGDRDNNSTSDEEQSLPHSQPDFLSAEAIILEDEELMNGGESERLVEELEKSKKLKWAKEDEACAAAVAAVGGEDFFLFGKKKKDKNEKQKRGRKPKEVVEEEDSDDDDDDEDDEDMEDDMEEEDGADESQKLEDATIYERYNYDGVNQGPNECELLELDESIRNLRTADEDEHNQIKLMIPASLTESDEEDWLDYDNDFDNHAGLYQKLDASSRKEEIFGLSDSDDSDKEDNAVNVVDEDDETNNENLSTVDQYRQQQAGDGTVNDGQEPCCSKTIATTVPPQPPRSSLAKKGGRGKKKSVTLDLGTIINDFDKDSTPTQSTSQAGTSENDVNNAATGSTESGPTQNQTKDPTEGLDADFRRFTDWVFNQNNYRDTHRKIDMRSDLMKRLDLSEDEVRRYQKMTSANLASVKGEVFQDEPVMQDSAMPLLAPPTNVEARSSLQSLAIFLTHGEDPSVFPWKSINVQQQMNDDFVNHENIKRLEQQKLDMTNPAMKNKLVNKQDDFLIQLLVYQNTDPEDVLPDEVKLFSEPRLGYELHVLGSQTVRDLMNAFHCENDYVCLKDVPHPDNYKEDRTQCAKTHYPQAMLLIHDTIYADPSCKVDYVRVINEWAAKPPAKHIGPFQRGDWNTRLKDLTVSFGYPYVYIHLGGCEHIYVFTKSRLLHTEDDHLLKNYPKVVGPTRFKNVYCRVDNEYLARWAVLDFKEFPENPMLLCTECVRMYCYDKKKQKRGDFKLYPFTQLANIL